MSADIDDVIELNVGGVHYTTTRKTLTSDKNSLLAELFDEDNQSSSSSSSLIRDHQGRVVLDRDGTLFRFILDYLRDDTIELPYGFREKRRLEREAEYFKLDGLIKSMHTLNDTQNGCITIGYRGSFQFGKDGLADVKFRKLSRILICGRVNLCRDVFGDTLNESRDPDHGGPDRYTSRFFLKVITFIWLLTEILKRDLLLFVLSVILSPFLPASIHWTGFRYAARTRF